jgi:hypothetical protein
MIVIAVISIFVIVAVALLALAWWIIFRPIEPFRPDDDDYRDKSMRDYQ